MQSVLHRLSTLESALEQERGENAVLKQRLQKVEDHLQKQKERYEKELFRLQSRVKKEEKENVILRRNFAESYQRLQDENRLLKMETTKLKQEQNEELQQKTMQLYKVRSTLEEWGQIECRPPQGCSWKRATVESIACLATANIALPFVLRYETARSNAAGQKGCKEEIEVLLRELK